MYKFLFALSLFSFVDFGGLALANSNYDNQVIEPLIAQVQGLAQGGTDYKGFRKGVRETTRSIERALGQTAAEPIVALIKTPLDRCHEHQGPIGSSWDWLTGPGVGTYNIVNQDCTAPYLDSAIQLLWKLEANPISTSTPASVNESEKPNLAADTDRDGDSICTRNVPTGTEFADGPQCGTLCEGTGPGSFETFVETYACQ